MSREIEFRGLYNNNWVYGYLEKHNDVDGDSLFINEQQTLYEINPETIGQYTGLKDKNGKKIFEGDIIQYEDEILTEENTYKVVFSTDGYWCLKGNGLRDNEMLYYTDIFRYVKVVGTIFDKEEIC